jgi:hypothetical protein
MSITIYHDPIRDLIKVFERLYPDHDAEVAFCVDNDVVDGACGVTVFGAGCPQVMLPADLPYVHCTEILAHELAHVVAGEDDGHGEKWKAAFDALHAGYLEEVA